MRKIIVFGLILSLGISGLLCSCTPAEDVFPSLSYPETDTSETSFSDETASLNPSDLIELKLALPYSDTTVNRLVKYYYGVNNGLISPGTNALMLDLDFLDSIDIPWIVENIPISGDGADADSFSEDDMPDIILLGDIASDTGSLLVLNDILAMDPDYGNGDIYIEAFDSVTFNGQIYGIPHYATFTVLIGNSDFIPSDGRIPYSPTADELRSYVEEIDSQYSDEGVIAFTGAGSSFTGDLRAFTDQLYEDDLASDSDNENADPRYARNAAIWPSSSGNAGVWEEYYPGSLYYFRVPSFYDGSNNMTTVYPLGISASCEQPELCADIATFISYDTNALLLIERLESPSGYYPLVTDSNVWDSIRSAGGVNSVFTEDSYE
ncbi:MAG: extracellular solute-binding protein [Clostridiales bacterium]|nr:extracellular solute-binding protein [Clostridiales bacterium]